MRFFLKTADVSSATFGSFVRPSGYPDGRDQRENRYFEAVRPGYAMMAAEFVALGLATGFLFLATGKRGE